ncbi:two-partner secretion domain-containing protein [Caballeronia humi]|nr:filamentous hemagglutinin N-terminal domain-containing protein [Caballeronia humi]
MGPLLSICNLLASSICMLCATHALAAGPLPEGGRFIAGDGTIATQGNTLIITQGSDRAVIDWRNFSIGNGNTVSVNGNFFIATLARVNGGERSVIDGTLKSPGQFYLINPQGVLIGKTGVVTTGGNFVASTLDTENDAFMNRQTSLFSGGGNGSVINLGTINSTSSNVYLISRKLAENDGVISAPQGTVDIAVGDQVQMKDWLLLYDPDATPQTFVTAAGSHGDAVNKGGIHAIRIALQSADGNVYALAGNSGAIRATGTDVLDGRVWLVADRGIAHVHATIEARNYTGGGATVEARGTAVHLDDAAVRATQWNITADKLDIGPVTAPNLSRNLNNGTSIDATATRDDIHVTSNLRWSGVGALTVGAARSVSIDPDVTVASTGAGALTLRADAGGFNHGGSVFNRGTLDWSASTGSITALIDGGGTFTRGAVLLNPLWSARFSGLQTQLTSYRLVNTLVDLRNIENDMAGNYALGRDFGSGSPKTVIDPIGGATHTAFTGQFDGQHRVLTSFQMNGYGQNQKASDAFTGLFAEIGAGGVVRNLRMDGSEALTVSTPVGLIAGRNAGTISNVAVSTGSVTAQDPFFGKGAGGLAGINDGVIERSSSGAAVTGAGPIGGLAGINSGTIVQSYVTYGTRLLAAGGARGGGLAGVNRGNIAQSYSRGDVQTPYTGGLVSLNEGTISQSYASDSGGAAGARNLGRVASTNNGTIANDVYWYNAEYLAQSPGVFTGTQIPAANGRTFEQLSDPTAFASSWNFGPDGTWAMPTTYSTLPILRWQLGGQ